MSERAEWMTQNWTSGKLNALVKAIGEETATKILKSRWKVVEKDRTITLERILEPLFDKNGRRIPENLSANVCDANEDFRLNQLNLKDEVDYANRILRLHGCLSVDTKVTAQRLKGKTEHLLALIRNNSQIANVLNGVWLPVVLPQLITDDLGTILEQYLEGAGKSYIKTFSDRKFYNHRKNTLANNVSTTDGSRQDQLVERMKQGPVIGVYFSNPLQGFSIDASREQMSTLPREFILSGLDIAIAMVMYPDILARDWNTPGLDLAALSWQSSACSLCFGAYDALLDFGRTDNLADADDDCSGGLLFLG
ncbi:hypothetical protein KKC65_02025 [Patescibacteria group bacterium]|nr:hypothetical protein [Patescibacteria group bacterium]